MPEAIPMQQVVLGEGGALASVCLCPADWLRPDIPPEQPDFSQPTTFLPLLVAMAPYGAVILSVGVRPAYSDGTLHDWMQFLWREQSLQILAVAAASQHGMPALRIDAMQPTDAGQMRIRTTLLEDGGRLFNISTLAPEQIWPSVEATLDQLRKSFRVAITHGSKVALGLPAEAPAATPAPPAPPASADEARPDPSADESPVVTEDPRRAANPAPASDRPTQPADVALADDAASLDPDHPLNARLRDGGAGLVPRVVMTNQRLKFASVAAGAVESVFRVPFGWHVIDDGKRTLVFDAGGRMQINLSLRRRDGADPAAVLESILESLRSEQPGIEHMNLELAGMKCLAVRGLVIEGQPLQQAYLAGDVGRPELVLVARVTASEQDMVMAMNTAEVILTSLGPPSPEAGDGPEWWRKALALEAEGRLEDAEKTITAAERSLGAYSQVAYMYEQRLARLLAAGDRAGAEDAGERARHWLAAYASSATNGGEGAALSRERDERIAAIDAQLARK